MALTRWLQFSGTSSAGLQFAYRALLRSLPATVLILVGCSCGDDRREADAQGGGRIASTTAPTAASATDHFSKDVGRLLAGEEASFAFPVVNSSAETIRIKKAEDVKRDCGCSSLTPGLRELPSGARTAVTVTVRTAGKKGAFGYGGTITWTSAGGQQLTQTFLLRGVAIPPLTVEPEELTFDPDEVVKGVAKPLVLRENVPLAWETLQVFPAAGTEIVERKTEGDKVRLLVKCSPPAGVDNHSGHLQLLVQPRPGTSKVVTGLLSATVAIQARQTVDFDVTPKVVSLNVPKGGERASARLLLRGELVEKGPQIIEAISFEGYTVTWDLKRAGGTKAAILELTLRRQQVGRASGDRTLLLKVAGGRSIRLPVVEMPSPVPSP